MEKHHCRRVFALLLSLCLLLSLAACGGNVPELADTSSEPESGTVSQPESPKLDYYFINTLPEPNFQIRFPTFLEVVDEKYSQNDHTVGWLQIPGSEINEEVLCYTDPDDRNQYYIRRGFDREYYWPGVLYGDFRTKFGEGKREELSSNIVIYGHNLGKGHETEKFAPLLLFNDEEFARKTPYVYFSTRAEDLVWEVFAVFYVTVEMPYNRPDLTAGEFAAVIDECRKRSLYNYDTKVSAADKIVTLSTCCYSVPGIGTVPYPSDYRYVVMAKLVNPYDADKTEASFEVNPAPKAP